MKTSAAVMLLLLIPLASTTILALLAAFGLQVDFAAADGLIPRSVSLECGGSPEGTDSGLPKTCLLRILPPLGDVTVRPPVVDPAEGRFNSIRFRSIPFHSSVSLCYSAYQIYTVASRAWPPYAFHILFEQDCIA